MIGNQMPALASRAVHQDGAKMVCLLCDAMRRAFQTLLAGESHVVAGLHGLARGDGVLVGLHIFLWDCIAVCERPWSPGITAFGAVTAHGEALQRCLWCVKRLAQE